MSSSSSSSSSVRLLQVFDALSGIKRMLVLYSGMSKEEIAEVMRASFRGGKLVGLRDPTTSVIYPASVLSALDNPLSSSKVYETVMEREMHSSDRALVRSKSGYLSPTSSDGFGLESTQDDEGDGEGEGEGEEFESTQDDEGEDEDPEEEDEGDNEDYEGEDNDDDGGQTSLTLEENITEIQIITGIDNVSVDAALSLLPISSRSMDQPFPATISRGDFIEMFAVLKSLVPQSREQQQFAAESREFVYLLFDVLASTSAQFAAQQSASQQSSQREEISTTALASGLSLICGGVAKENLRSVFSLYEEQALASSDSQDLPPEGGAVPDEAVYLHLCSLFRIIFQLCGSKLREQARFTAEHLAMTMSLRMLHVVPRRFGQGLLTFSEFYACAVTGLQNGLILFHTGGQGSLPTPPSFERFSPLKNGSNGSSGAARRHSSQSGDSLGMMMGSLRRSLFSEESLGSERDDVEEDDEEDDEEQDDYSAELSRMADLEDSLVAASLVDYEGGPLSIPRAARLLGLLKYPPHEVFSAFKYIIDEDGEVSLASYQRFMGQLIGRHYQQLTVLQRAVADHIISQVFEVYDYEQAGAVRASQLAWALLLFCGGEFADKASVATDMLQFFKPDDGEVGEADTDVSADDMAQCLTSLLKAVRGLDPHFLGALSPYDVGLELTMNAFKHAGVSWHDDLHTGMREDKNKKLLDCESFQHWFAVVLLQCDSMSTADDESIYTPNTSRTSQTSGGEAPGGVSASSSLASFDNEEKWGQRVFDEGGNCISREDASGGYAPWVAERSGRRHDSTGADQRKPPLTIDTDFTEEVDDGGDEEEGDDDDYIRGTQQDQETANESPSAIVLELRRARSLLGLDAYPAEDLMETLGERSTGGFLPYSAWLETIQFITQLAGRQSSCIEALTLGRKLFDAFSPAMIRGEPCVAFVPFVAGLSSLCSSPPEDKFAVSFALIDGDSDGHITSTEFYTLVLSYLNVVSACSALAEAKLGAAKVPLGHLARAVVAEAQRTCGPGDFSRETVAEIATDCIELHHATDF